MKPVSMTAFYCCAIRAWDASLPAPVLGDRYAERFLTDEARRVMEPYRAERYPNAANVVRPRIIEESLADDLRRSPRRLIVLVGAGFDSRAFRLPTGRFVEVDEVAVLAHKESRLPAASAPNPLTRVPIDFATESLEEKLAPWRGEADVTIVVEGVTMYLTQAQVAALLATLTAVFPTQRCYVTWSPHGSWLAMEPVSKRGSGNSGLTSGSWWTGRRSLSSRPGIGPSAVGR